jgi:hypothetical protein
MFDDFRWKPRKITAAVIGWPSAALLGVSAFGMFVFADLAKWGVGLALLGIAVAVLISSKTLRAKIAAMLWRNTR